MLEDVKTPQELMTFLDKHIEYGIINSNGLKITNSNSEEFAEACNHDWKVRNVNEIISSGVGHCYDQVEVERYWFKNNKYKFKTFWVCVFLKDVENSGFLHTYLVYKEAGNWCLFEHSDFSNRGIYYFSTLKEAVEWQTKKQKAYARSVLGAGDFRSFVVEFTKPKEGLNMREYIEFVKNCKNFE